MAPFTGPAASIGINQVHWAQYYQRTYNATHSTKIKFVNEDTMLGSANGTAEAVKGAQALGSNPSVLGVVGPAGSNEVKATTGALKGAGLGFVSGSATNTQITTDGTRTGYFFRTVPPDSSQSQSVSAYITGKLKATKVYILDDQEAYSIGLADEVQTQLKAKGVTVGRDGVSQQQSDFSAIINKIPRDTEVVYLPWQLPPKGQAFGQQMKSLGRGSVKLMGSDGLFDPLFSGSRVERVRLVLPGQPAGQACQGVQEAPRRSRGALRRTELCRDAGRVGCNRPGLRERDGQPRLRFGRSSRRRRSPRRHRCSAFPCPSTRTVTW